AAFGRHRRHAHGDRLGARRRRQREQRDQERAAHRDTERETGLSCRLTRAVSPLSTCARSSSRTLPAPSLSCTTCVPAATRRPGDGVMKPEYCPSIHAAAAPAASTKSVPRGSRSASSTIGAGWLPSSGLIFLVAVS